MKKIIKKYNKKRGFTLVELLAVVTILGIIALIIIPVVENTNKKIKQKAYDNQKESILLALEDYRTSNQTKFIDQDKVTLTLLDLKEQGFIDYEMRNPKNNKCLSNDIPLTVVKNKKGYDYYIGQIDNEGNLIGSGELIDTDSNEDCVDYVHKLKSGLYDKDDNLLASWDDLINVYGMNIEWGSHITSITSGGLSEDSPNSPARVFSDNDKLKSGVRLIIDDELTEVPSYAFYGAHLLSIIIPESITSIKTDAFAYNDLTSVIIPKNVKNIGGAAFTHNKLTTLTIPDGVTTVSSMAFSNNELHSVTIPSSIKKIDKSVFKYNKLESVIIPNSITAIAGEAFHSNKLTNIIIPNSVKTIGDYAFAYNDLVYVTFNEGITTIGQHAFQGNEILSLELPIGLTEIKDFAFSENKMTSVTLSSTITKIGSGAFSQNQLTNLVIPSSVTSIGSGAFYKNELSNVELPNTLSTIENNVFNNNKLTSITLPNNLISIGDGAFYSNKLVNVTIPASVTSIGVLSFKYNNTLISITFENPNGWKGKCKSFNASSVYGNSTSVKCSEEGKILDERDMSDSESNVEEFINRNTRVYIRD